MRRSIMLLPLIAMPAFAQEEPVEKPDLADLIERIRKAEPEQQQELFEELQKLIAGRRKLDIRAPETLILQLGMNRGREMMEGQWAEPDGITGKYKMTSIGKSRYRLEAVRNGPEGETTKIVDEGTLAELRKKYTFLKGFMVLSLGGVDGGLRLPPSPAGARSPFVLTAPPTSTALGMTLRRPSKDLEFHLKLPTETTWIVDSVEPGSRADELGLKKMDLLTEADGSDLSELKTLKEAKEALALLRRGKAKRLSLAEAAGEK